MRASNRLVGLGAIILMLASSACREEARITGATEPETSKDESQSPQSSATTAVPVNEPGGAEGTSARARAVAPAEWVIGPSVHKVFLTFDGRPRARALDKVLAALDRRDAEAAFFLPASWVAGHRPQVGELVESGQTIGNRGYGYRTFTNLSKKEIRSSLRKAERVLTSVGASVGPFVRTPGGARDRGVLGAAGALGYRSVRWTYRPGAGVAEGIVKKILDNLRPGAIISLDLWRESHVNALPQLLRRLEKDKWSSASIKKLKNTRPVRWDLEVGPGFEGGVVRYLQERLAAATYPAGEPDGKFGAMTVHAVYAFQKVHGLERDAVISPEEMEMIATLEAPEPPRGEGGSYIDIDLTRQVLFEIHDGKVVSTLPISTGNGATYESEGDVRIASTPRGDFAFDRKIPGWRVSDLGQLYYPLYFYGGYAVHGSTSVPPYPASHGCVRIPMHVAAEFYERNLLGTPVYVHD